MIDVSWGHKLCGGSKTLNSASCVKHLSSVVKMNDRWSGHNFSIGGWLSSAEQRSSSMQVAMFQKKAQSMLEDCTYKSL